jgi:hypothetical protein
VKFGPEILRKVIAAGVPRNTVINVNFPACAPEEVRGVRVTRQGKRNLGFLKVDQRRDGRGNPYFWIGFERAAMMDTPAEGTDLAALSERYVSVTPLRLDRTDEAFSTARQLERLLQRRAVAILLGQARGAIAGRKDERPVARIDQFGNRRDHLAVDVDVEDGEVEISGLGELDRLVDIAGLRGHAVTEFFQHVGDHHPDHDLILHEEHRTARRSCRRHDGFLALPESNSQITHARAM